MAYFATVIPIMIASPSDVLDERQVARDIINEWNYLHSLRENVVLMPVGWETHAAPDLAGRPQELINNRVLADCDLLVGIFWTRLGTPTGDHLSGTVEEIRSHISRNKPAMIYFSTRPVAPQSLQPEQFAALTKFKSWCEKEGLIEIYDNIDDFREKLRRHLQLSISKNPYLSIIFDQSKIRSNPGASITSEKNQTDISDEAKEMLFEAAQNGSGRIMKIFVVGGRYIQVANKNFGTSRDQREFVRYERGLQQLIDKNLITQRNSDGSIFEITANGYDYIDSNPRKYS